MTVSAVNYMFKLLNRGDQQESESSDAQGSWSQNVKLFMMLTLMIRSQQMDCIDMYVFPEDGQVFVREEKKTSDACRSNMPTFKKPRCFHVSCHHGSRILCL